MAHRRISALLPPSESSAARFMSTPIRRIRSFCCARAASGHAAAVPPSSVAYCVLECPPPAASPPGKGHLPDC